MKLDRQCAIAYGKLLDAIAADSRCQTMDDAYRRTASATTKKALRRYENLKKLRDEE